MRSYIIVLVQILIATKKYIIQQIYIVYIKMWKWYNILPRGILMVYYVKH